MIIVLYLFFYLSFCDPILDRSSCDPFSVFSSVSDHRHNRPFPLHLPSCITLSQGHTPPANCHVLPRPFNIDFLVIEKVALSAKELLCIICHSNLQPSKAVVLKTDLTFSFCKSFQLLYFFCNPFLLLYFFCN